MYHAIVAPMAYPIDVESTNEFDSFKSRRLSVDARHSSITSSSTEYANTLISNTIQYTSTYRPRVTPPRRLARDDNGKLMLNCHPTKTVNPRNDGAIRVISV